MRVLLSVFVLLCATGCGEILRKKATPDPVVEQAITKPLSPEETEELLNQVGNDWFYGPGLGKTALNVGAVVAFPPFAVYLVGNSLLEMGGYEPIEISDALGEEGSAEWDEAYDGVASGPGRVTAAVAGEQFRTKETIDRDMSEFLKQVNQRQNRQNPQPTL